MHDFFSHQSSAIFKTLIEMSRDPYYVVSPEHDFALVYANSAAIEHWGYPKEQLLQMRICDWDPEWTLEELRVLWQHFDRKRQTTIQTKHRIASGKMVPVEVTLNHFVIENDEFIGGYFYDISAREQSIRRLAESEHRFRMLADTSPNGVFQADAEGNNIYSNPSWETIAGRSAAETFGKGWLAAFHPDDQTRLLTSWNQAVSAGMCWETEARVVRPSGEIRRCILRAAPEHDEQNKIISFVGTVVDITELHQALMDARDNETRYRAMLDASVDGVILANATTLQLTSANQQAIQMLGYPAKMIPRLKMLDLHPQWVHAEIQQLTPNKFLKEIPVKRQDGSIFFADISSAVIILQEKPCLVRFFHDVTEQKLIQEDLLRHKEQLVKAEAIAHIGNWKLDLQTERLHWSDEMYRILELPANTVPTHATFIAITHPDDRAMVSSAYQRLKQTNQPYAIDHRLLLSDGRIRYVKQLGEVERNAEQQPFCCFGTVQDVTAERQAEALLKARENELRTLLETTRSVPWQFNLETQRFSYMGSQIERLLGYPMKSWQTMDDWIQRIHPDDRDWAPLYCQTETAIGRDHEFEYRALRIDGEIVWIRDAVALLKDADGQPTDMIGYFLDVTQQKEFEAALRASEAQYRAVIETSGDGFWLIDARGFLLETNAAYSRISGYSLDELVGMHISQIEAEESAQETAAHIEKIIREGSDLFETRHRTKSGKTLHIEVSVSYSALGGGRFFSFLRDISERKRTEAELHLVAQVFKNTSEGIVITNPKGTIVDVNDAYCRIMGYEREEMIGANPKKVSSGRHDRTFFEQMWCSLEEEGFWVGEVWDRRKNGEIFPKWLTINAVYSPTGELTHYVGTFSDISTLKQVEEQLQHLAYHDALTELPNRILFQDRLTQELAIGRRYQQRIAVLFMDLDRFKLVNDTMGHSAGDELLIQVAQRLRKMLRENDTVARLGGDEFTLIARDVTSIEAVASLANRIIRILSRPFTIMGKEVRVGSTIGISIFPDDGLDFETLTKHADAAMYEAKNAGRGQYRFYASIMDERAHRRLSMESELYHALEKQQFVVYLQPQMTTDGLRLIGAEALVRWQHPEYGLVAPNEFISLAEETGLILPIGQWVIETVCAQISDWLERKFIVPSIAINISARQFHQEDLICQITSTVEESGVSKRALEFEITETVAMTEADRAEIQLKSLYDSGYSVAIDDFGTGYSSLNYLKRFPVSKLKIDRTFIKDTPDDANDTAIVHAMIQIAHTLDIKVVAEGVETERQRHFLAEHGCDFIQGYLIGYPMPMTEFERCLEKNTCLL